MSASEADAGQLREVPGPSAFGGGWRRFVHLLWLSSVTEFKVRYVESALGYVWTLLRPLLFFGVVFLVLRQVIGFGADVENYAALLMMNIILFQYFQEATTRSVRSVVMRENLVRKTHFPRIVIPLSISLTGAFTLGLNLIAGFALLIVFGVRPTATWLLFPAVLILLIALTTATGMLLSVLYVHYRDVTEVWSVISRVLFYATPILYPIELVPESFRAAIATNPLAPIFELTRVWVIDPSAPGPVEAAGGLLPLVVPLMLFAGICVLALWLFDREAPRVAEAL